MKYKYIYKSFSVIYLMVHSHSLFYYYYSFLKIRVTKQSKTNNK